MNTLFYNRRLLGMAMAPLFVFFLARVLVFVGLPQPSYKPSFSHWMAPRVASSPKVVSHVHGAIVPAKIAPPVQAAPVVAQPMVMNVLSLKSGLHDYAYHLTGEVTCGGAPCEAELRLSIQTDRNPDMKQVFSTTPDGRFDRTIVVTENAHEPIDWRVMVYTPHTYPTEIRGRQILTDETTLDIHRSIQLP